MSEQKIGCVPDGYMPIPTAEQIADALENVRSYHDLGAELIAPELLANLLASTTVKAEQVQCDPRDIAGDTGRAEVDAMIGRLTSADPDFNDCADAAALLRRLVMEEISGPSGYATWRDAAVAERVKRVAMKPNENIVQIAHEGLEVYAGPNMNERKVCAEIIRLAEFYSTEQTPSLPAAGSSDLTAVRCQCCANEYPHDSYDAGFIAGSGMCQVCDAAMPPKDLPAAGSAELPEPDFALDGGSQPCYYAETVQRIVAALSAQQSAPWAPSGADYDRAIHRNPDAKAWADFFIATFPGQADKHDLMLGWFANAMMAVHDHLEAQQSAHVSVPMELLRSVCSNLPEKMKPARRELRALLNGGEA